MAATDKRVRIALIIAIIGVCAGIAIFAFAYQNSLLRLAGVIICVISVYSFRAVRQSALSRASGGGHPRPRPPLWMWGTAMGLFVALVASGLALYADAKGGYHDVLPVYAFAASGLTSAAFFAYFSSKLF